MSNLRYLPPPHDRVKGEVNYWESGDDSTCLVTYHGSADDLIAAGCATAEMLAPAKAGKHRLDADGDHFSRTKLRTVREGVIVERFKVHRWKPIGRAKLLPCAVEWAALNAQEEAEREQRAQNYREAAEAYRLERDHGITSLSNYSVNVADAKECKARVGRNQWAIRWISSGALIVPNWYDVREYVKEARTG